MKNVGGKNFLVLSGRESRKASQSHLKMLITLIIVLREKQAILGFSELPPNPPANTMAHRGGNEMHSWFLRPERITMSRQESTSFPHHKNAFKLVTKHFPHYLTWTIYKKKSRFKGMNDCKSETLSNKLLIYAYSQKTASCFKVDFV